MPAPREHSHLGRPAGDPARSRRACAAWALLCVCLAASAQFLTVRYNYDGNASALFFTGAQQRLPPSLENHVYRTDHPEGFDGQFYHLIAHDPLLREGFEQYVANPRLRWCRILVPALAHLLALGQFQLIDYAYFSVILGFLFLGAYWVGRYVMLYGLHPSYALSLLLVPGVFISLEQMAIDVALVTLCAGFAWYETRGGSWKLYAVLALCPFARETGVLVAAAYGAYELFQNRRARAAASATALAPYALWAAYVHWHTSEDATLWFVHYPFEGLVERTLTPLAFEITGRWVAAVAVCDYLGILVTWVSFAAVVYLLRKHPRDAVLFASAAFVALAGLLGKPDIWGHAYGFARIFSPLYLWLAMIGMRRRKWWLAAPLVVMILRMVVQSWVHIAGILRGITG